MMVWTGVGPDSVTAPAFAAMTKASQYQSCEREVIGLPSDSTDLFVGFFRWEKLSAVVRG